MRVSVELQGAKGWHFGALREQETFLYRRVTDGDREVLGVGALSTFRHTDTTRTYGAVFGQWRNWWQAHTVGEWAFGHVAYDAKNGIEDLISRSPDHLAWPDLYWFIPKWVFEKRGGQWWLHAHEEHTAEGVAMAERMFMSDSYVAEEQSVEVPWSEPDRVHYLAEASKLMGHIHRGDIYEVNHCVERVAEVRAWDPYSTFQSVQAGLQAPHAGFYRLGSRYALCFSPERFLQGEAGSVITQPMKGTRPRHLDPARDRALATELANDAKERAENIMAVDVARHDLSRVAAPNGVEVTALCAVHSLPAVHQMVSTVSCRTAAGVGPVDVVRAGFPPASMTGAPKISAMRLIDEAEGMRRGLYAGALGFVDPSGRYDLNVVIRTLQYRADTGRLSLMTGSALTANCDPEKEWEECTLKAASVLRYLSA